MVRQKKTRVTRKNVVRKGKAISVMYVYNGVPYRHTFETPANIEIMPGKLVISGPFGATIKHGITD